MCGELTVFIAASSARAPKMQLDLSGNFQIFVLSCHSTDAPTRYECWDRMNLRSINSCCVCGPSSPWSPLITMTQPCRVYTIVVLNKDWWGGNGSRWGTMKVSCGPQ